VWRAQAATGSTGLDETFRAPSIKDGNSGNERDCSSVELQVRDARLTDIDRITGLMERADGRWTLDQLNNAAEVLRQMVYLPNASIVVCLDGRIMVGVAVLAQRPSAFAGGLVGTVDVLVVEPGNELDGVAEALLRELVRQARNKGCVSLEGSVPAEPADQARWESLGFTEAGPRMSLSLARSAVPSW
jgi:GNAT superfamily N-acetyltransferase